MENSLKLRYHPKTPLHLFLGDQEGPRGGGGLSVISTVNDPQKSPAPEVGDPFSMPTSFRTLSDIIPHKRIY